MQLIYQIETYRACLPDSAAEHESVHRFMREHAFATYQCAPPASTGTVIGVWKDETVVGSVALDYRSSDEPFPLEELYERSAIEALFPEGFDRTKIVQAGRWFSSVPRSPVSRCVFEALTAHARERGIRKLFAEGKDYTVKIFRKWGYACPFNQESAPNLKRIPPEGRNYYETAPLPHLFRLDF